MIKRKRERTGESKPGIRSRVKGITYAREIKIENARNRVTKFDEFLARSEKLYGFSAFSLMRANISNRGK